MMLRLIKVHWSYYPNKKVFQCTGWCYICTLSRIKNNVLFHDFMEVIGAAAETRLHTFQNNPGCVYCAVHLSFSNGFLLSPAGHKRLLITSQQLWDSKSFLVWVYVLDINQILLKFARPLL